MEGGEGWREGDQRKGKKYFMYLNEDLNPSCFLAKDHRFYKKSVSTYKSR